MDRLLPDPGAKPEPGAVHPGLTVNGHHHGLGSAGSATLLQVLRNDLGLNGPKFGCGLGECGACTVLVDGIAARACVIPARGVAGRCITTLEGLPALAAAPLHPVQQAFLQAQAAQCGYCLNGMVMMTVALLQHTPQPDESQIRQALSHNLCRCGTHLEIIRAVQLAAVLVAQSGLAKSTLSDEVSP